MDVDFAGLSCIKGFTYTLYNYQKDCWNTWNTIESSNSNVSTAHGLGNYAWSYYTFTTKEEKNKFDIGLSLHVQYIGGYIPIQPVQKN
jgi:hypothetical protein